MRGCRLSCVRRANADSLMGWAYGKVGFGGWFGGCYIAVCVGLFVGLFSISVGGLRAQGRLQVILDTKVAGSSTSFLPFYHFAHQQGRFGEEGWYGFSQLGLRYTQRWGDWRVHGRVSGYVQQDRGHLQEAEVRVDWRQLRVHAGKAEMSDSSSIGNLGHSNHAAPFYQIGIGLYDYLPLDRSGWVAIKGRLVHGWLDRDRVTSRPYWHHKSLSVRFGQRGWWFAAGLRHYAFWGGYRGENRVYEPTLENYLRVFSATAIAEEDGLNAGGSHVGVYDFSLTMPFRRAQVVLYAHKLFEDGVSSRNFLQWDGVWGAKARPRQGVLEEVGYALLSTTFQGGPGLPDPTDQHPDREANRGYSFRGRDDNYNNYFYPNGYTFLGYSLGNPLLFTRARAAQFGAVLQEYPADGETIVNNRVVAHHMHVKLRLGRWRCMARVTYTRNFGTYTGLYGGRFEWAGVLDGETYYFSPVRDQWYSQLQVRYNFHTLPMELSLGLAGDVGSLYDNIGFVVGMRYGINLF